MIAFIFLYQQGKVDKEEVEEELSQLPPDEQERWRPVIDNPELLAERLQELLKVA